VEGEGAQEVGEGTEVAGIGGGELQVQVGGF
jgi:hypothetical protein